MEVPPLPRQFEPGGDSTFHDGNLVLDLGVVHGRGGITCSEHLDSHLINAIQIPAPALMSAATGTSHAASITPLL